MHHYTPKVVGKPHTKPFGMRKIKKHSKKHEKLQQEDFDEALHREEVRKIRERIRKNKHHRKHNGPKAGIYKRPVIEQEQQPISATLNKNLPSQALSQNSELVFAFLDLLIEKGIVTKEEIKARLDHEVKKEQGISTHDNKEFDPSTAPIKLVKDGHVVMNGEHKVDKGTLRARWLMMMRANNLFCCLCGTPIKTADARSPWRVTAEHTWPKSAGGKADSTNLLPAHSVCNALKTNIKPQIWEKVGYDILTSRGIHINPATVSYQYMQLQRQR